MLRSAVLLFLLAAHFLYGSALARMAARLGGPRGWAYVPILNLLLPLRLAGRSLGWAALYVVPPINVAVWILLWGEIAQRVGRPAWSGFAMALPGPNLAVAHWLAGRPPRVAAALAALVVLGVPIVLLASRLDRQGRAARDMAALRGGDAAARRAAAAALGRERDVAAGPALMAALRDPDPAVRSEAALALGVRRDATPPTLDALSAAARDPAPEVRAQAALALHRCGAGSGLGSSAREAVRGLLEAARGRGERPFPDPELVLALATQGRAEVDALADALRDADVGVRWHAAAALMQIGAEAHAAVPKLMATMADDVWEVRNASGRALEEVVTHEEAPALARALADPSAETRYHVARALGRLGPGAAAALPALVQALGDPDWEVRMESASALAAAGPGARAAVPALAAALQDREPQVRVSVAWSLARVGPSDAPRALQPALRDPDPDVRRAARAALAHTAAMRQ